MSAKINSLATRLEAYMGSVRGKLDRKLDDNAVAASAAKLQAAFRLSLTGPITGNVNIDGSGNVSLATTITPTGATAGWATRVRLNAAGQIIDTGLLQVADIPSLDASKITDGVFAAARIPTLNQNTTGSAATLATARTLTIGATGKSFNGSGNVSWTLAEIGAAPASHTHAASDITSGVFAAARIPTLNQNTTGSAATLATARTLTIGSTGKTFNGSANVSWSLAEIGAAAASHTHAAGDITSGTFALARIPVLDSSKLAAGIVPDRATSLGTTDLDTVQDPGFYYQSVTANATAARNYPPAGQAGSLVVTIAAGVVQEYTTYGPNNRKYIRGFYGSSWSNWVEIYRQGITIATSDVPNLDAGKVTSGVFAAARIPTLNQNTTGSAATLATARTLTIGNTAKTFNGSANVSWTLAEIGAVATNDSRLTNARDWTASLVSQAEAQAGTATTERKWSALRVAQAIAANGLSIGTTATTAKAGNWTPAVGDIPALPVSKITGLQAALNEASGLAVGGSSNDPNTTTAATILTNHANSPGLSKYWHISTTFWSAISSTGNRSQLAVEYNFTGTTCRAFVRSCFSETWSDWCPIGNSQIVGNDVPDLPASKVTSGTFAAARIPNLDASKVTSGVFAAARIPTLNQNTTGNAATATTLATARTIGGVSFNGSANINLPGVNIAGNQNTSGNAATATALATARTIGGVSFDGSANINLPGVNTTGNQNTTGSAASLTSARTINGTGFNGTANITTATWGTARTLTIGSTGKSVNGSANVAWTLAEIGAAAASHTHAASDITSGVFDAARIPTLNQNTTGSAATLATARTLTIGSTGKTFNGSANVAWTLAEIGAAAASATVNLTGNQTIAGTKDFSGVLRATGTANATSATSGAMRSAGGLGVALNIWAGGNVTAYSDIRKKRNVRTIDDALDIVLKTRGVYYTRKDTGSDEVGYIAQEMLNVLPRVVSGNDESGLGINYGPMSAVATEAIKQLYHGVIMPLRADVNVLVNAVDKLTQENQILTEALQILSNKVT